MSGNSPEASSRFCLDLSFKAAGDNDPDTYYKGFTKPILRTSVHPDSPAKAAWDVFQQKRQSSIEEGKIHAHGWPTFKTMVHYSWKRLNGISLSGSSIQDLHDPLKKDSSQSRSGIISSKSHCLGSGDTMIMSSSSVSLGNLVAKSSMKSSKSENYLSRIGRSVENQDKYLNEWDKRGMGGTGSRQLHSSLGSLINQS